ncbi:MAG: phosphoserine aminotransferase, partial [Pseudomonadota bacterium]|nr:phosphoserine aminotransferase [Pseudomonadota bacterium]
MIEKPKNKPRCLNFSSGPCTKRPGWSVDVLEDALLGRSHRSTEGKNKLKKAIDDTKRLLCIPDNYEVGIVPASDTGAIEMAMWNLLGSRPVEVLSWEVFGKDWKKDIQEQLKIPESN